MREFHHESGCSLVIDDDGRVGWAYLLDPEHTIIADVWLYNRSVGEADWADLSQAPFPNPAEYARPFDGPLPAEADFDVTWQVDGALLLVDVLVRGTLLARVSPGAQPGWNVLATRDGPLAQVMPDDESGGGL